MQKFNYEILDLGLVYYKNVIKNSGQLIADIEELDQRCALEGMSESTSVKQWVPWTYGSGDSKLMFCWQKFIPQVKDIQESDCYKKEQIGISSQLFDALDNALEHYSTEIYPFAGKNIKSRENMMHLLKYEDTGHLPAHQDQGVSTRVLSALLYLNDNYDGGEIEFSHSGIKLKPEAGSLLFFPSNFLYVHEVYPVINGKRYSLPNWYHNVPLSLQRGSTGEA